MAQGAASPAPAYDKKSSFFDSISCEALDKAKADRCVPQSLSDKDAGEMHACWLTRPRLTTLCTVRCDQAAGSRAAGA